MPAKFDASIIIHAYNQSGKLAPCIIGVEDAMREAKIARYEIIIAEDGSKDGTLEEAKAI